MLEVIGDVLPSAVGIAISPIPIIAVILMLMSPRSKQLGLGFLVGWLVGVLVATTVFTLLAGIIPEPDTSDGSKPVMAVIQLLLGLGLLFLAVRQWRSRPAPGVDAELPAWMSKIDTMKPFAATGLALLLSGVNPKNLLLAAAAGTMIGRSGENLGEELTLVLIFALIASLTVAIPVITAIAAPKKAADVLSGIRTWLTANNAVIMTVLFIVLGVSVVGKGLGNF
ncbi:GAP family protein [Microbacterium sp. H1-D42]|uniref:GAP family protein n=1 Tax=Microbacterium sp. H1-D42 TaxID=2925844 RepID=UPI001F5337F0|nr:GAP family protein [Microbacterium sp. H1-D42]UNK71571.1 GAP family protein [Microbacterium sp. H1-D42]